jgi:Tubulin binding cofactor A
MLKEVAYYEVEVKENEAKLAEMKLQSDKDQYDIKQFEHVLGESYMMVPDATRRLQTALDDLADFVAHYTTETRDDSVVDANKEEWFVTAKLLLKENHAMNNSERGGIVATCVDDLADGEAF